MQSFPSSSFFFPVGLIWCPGPPQKRRVLGSAEPWALWGIPTAFVTHLLPLSPCRFLPRPFLCSVSRIGVSLRLKTCRGGASPIFHRNRCRGPFLRERNFDRKLKKCPNYRLPLSPPYFRPICTPELTYECLSKSLKAPECLFPNCIQESPQINIDAETVYFIGPDTIPCPLPLI